MLPASLHPPYRPNGQSEGILVNAASKPHLWSPRHYLVFSPHFPSHSRPSNTKNTVHKPLPVQPSAPHVPVQPTRTPLFLSIIPKQQRRSLPHESQPRVMPLDKPEPKSPPLTPRVKQTRLSFPSSLPAQVEAPVHIVSEPKNPSPNFFDPFFSYSPDSDLIDTKSKPTPKPLPPPKLARPSGTLTPTLRVIPTRRSNNEHFPNAANVSRSAPVSDSEPTVLRAHAEDPLPICDDAVDGKGGRRSVPVQKVPSQQ